MRQFARIAGFVAVAASVLAAERSKAVGCTGDWNEDGVPYEVSGAGYVTAISGRTFTIGEVTFELPSSRRHRSFCVALDDRDDDSLTYDPIRIGDWINTGGTLRADGSVGRYPWGKHPVGSIVVEGGSCYLQIASSDVPSFAPDKGTVGEQMKASLLSTYIAYTGPCTINEADGSVTLKVVAAWRPDYVGTEQKRFFRFENGKMFFGPAPNSGRAGSETLSRRLTLERVGPGE